jgi:hypothetical protein
VVVGTTEKLVISESKTGDSVLMGVELFKHLSCLYVPELNGTIVSTREKSAFKDF